ncbi:hypothetical protein [Halostella litorea]|uniref:hypothetical protein n=1 Tax=Halostella litorea TaxID=2528831 RepID=UPI0013867093|nr:hypothetical protein [Halostella litorea]
MKNNQRFGHFKRGPFFLFQIALSAVALVVWVRDGTPGLATLRAVLTDVPAMITK